MFYKLNNVELYLASELPKDKQIKNSIVASGNTSFRIWETTPGSYIIQCDNKPKDKKFEGIIWEIAEEPLGIMQEVFYIILTRPQIKTEKEYRELVKLREKRLEQEIPKPPKANVTKIGNTKTIQELVRMSLGFDEQSTPKSELESEPAQFMANIKLSRRGRLLGIEERYDGFYAGDTKIMDKRIPVR